MARITNLLKYLTSLTLSGFPFPLFFFRLVSCQHLETVIRQRIPSIIALINKTIDELNAELDRIGRPIAVDSGVRTGPLWKSVFFDRNDSLLFIYLLISKFWLQGKKEGDIRTSDLCFSMCGPHPIKLPFGAKSLSFILLT